MFKFKNQMGTKNLSIKDAEKSIKGKSLFIQEDEIKTPISEKNVRILIHKYKKQRIFIEEDYLFSILTDKGKIFIGEI